MYMHSFYSSLGDCVEPLSTGHRGALAHFS